MKLDRPNWQGHTVVCIASGPSLTAADCELVRGSGHPTIVTNTTFQLCPWADVLYAMDSAWWHRYRAEVERAFAGMKVSAVRAPVHEDVRTTADCPWFTSFGNSGTGAIALALAGGADSVLLLGYDCQPAVDGRVHWHGDHPQGLSNGKTLKQWPRQFAQVADAARWQGVPVLNASRATALTCFDRVLLEDALALAEVAA